MALAPIYQPEAAAKILWRLILTGRARIEDFDSPPPGYQGNPETFRNLAREYEHLKEDSSVLEEANRYNELNGKPPERVEVISPRDLPF